MSDRAAEAVALELGLLELEAAVAALSAPQFRRPLLPHERAANTDFAAIAASADSGQQRLLATLLAGRRSLLRAAAAWAGGSGVDAAEVLRLLLSPALAASLVFTDAYERLVDQLRAQLAALADSELRRAFAELVAQGLEDTALPDGAELALIVEAQARRLAVTVLTSVQTQLQQAAGAVTVAGVDAATSGADLAVRLLGDALAMSEQALVDLAGQGVNVAGGGGRLVGVAAAGDVARYYSSEILDQNTCTECLAVDGTQYATLDDAQVDYPVGTYAGCLGGGRCRGTLVAVMASEQPATMP